MKMSQIKTCFAKGWMIVIIAFTLLSGTPALGEELKPSPDSGLFNEILKMETLLLRPCDKVETLMDNLIKYGRGYQLKEEERAALYVNWADAFVKLVSDFIVIADEKGTAVPGKFLQAFYALQKEAEAGGVLADGPKPNVTLIDLVKSPVKDKYYYFEEPGSEGANKKKGLRYKLETACEKLAAEWNVAREAFNKQFDDNGEMKNYEKALDGLTKEGKDYEKKYNDTSAELTTLATGGNFEHCLGKIKGMSYVVSGGLLDPLYAKGEDKTPGSLPGMGYKFVEQRQYKAFLKPEVGDLPPLNLKFNGTDYQDLEIDLLKIKKQTLEEQIRIEGGGLGGIGSVIIKTKENVKDLAGLGVAAVGLSVDIVVGVAVLSKDFVIHPQDTLIEIGQKSREFFKKVGDIKVIEVGRQLNDWTNKKVTDSKNAIVEIGKNLGDWDRFEVKPGEGRIEEINKRKAELDSMEKVDAGLRIGENLMADWLTGLTAVGALGAAVKAVKFIQAERKAASVLKKMRGVVDSAKAMKKTSPVMKELQDSAKAVEELAEEQAKLAKKLDDIAAKKLPEKLVEDPEYVKLLEKQNTVSNKLIKTADDLEHKVVQLEKSLDEVPKAPPPGTGSGAINSVEKAAADAVEAKRAAALEKELLKGSKSKELAEAAGKAWKATDFAEGKLDAHFAKHVEKGLEWGADAMTKEKYLEKAKNLMNSPIKGDIDGFVSKEGTVFRYNKAANEFGTAKPGGTIETLFRPKGGMAYWEEQMGKYKPK